MDGAIDALLIRKIGITSADLPDICYRDMYDDGEKPRRAAALKCCSTTPADCGDSRPENHRETMPKITAALLLHGRKPAPTTRHPIPSRCGCATGIRREHLASRTSSTPPAQPVKAGRAARFERLATTGKIYTCEPVTQRHRCPDGRAAGLGRGESWHNHVARLRVKDNELIVHISQEAYSAYEEE